MLIDPNETIIASLGNNYIQSIIGSRSIQRGFAILTDKRVYYSGQVFSGKGRGANASTEECVIPIENITRTRFIYNQGFTALILGIWLVICGLFAFVTALSDGSGDFLTFFTLGLVIAGVFLIAAYFLNRTTVFEVTFPGGGFTFSVKFYPMEDMREFQRQLHLTRDMTNRKLEGLK